jgi:prophage tail gpP-like protein
MATDPDLLSLVVNGQALTGWQSVRVTAGIERCPRDFDIELTEKDPQATQVQIQAGNPCTVMIGQTLVVTGYVDRYIPSFAPGAHSVRIVGRGKAEDVTDSSVEWPGGQITGANALSVAQKLCQPYGITVSSTAPAGPSIPQFNLNLTESAWEVIEEISRFAGLLAYDGADGNLILAQAGTQTHASGFQEGVNVQTASVVYSMDQRFSEVDAWLQGTETLGEAGNGGNLLYRATDPQVPRHRRKSIITEATYGGQDVAKQRALWEVARRAGRSASVTLTTDTWRDSAGNLWTPNWLASVNLPALKLQTVTWCVAEVTFLRARAGGTMARLTLMDPKAFQPEPILLAPVIRGLAQ